MEKSLNDVDLQKIKELEHKGLNLRTEFLWFNDEEVIKLILSRVQDDCIVLDKPYPITKEIVLIVTGLCDGGSVMVKKYIKK